MKTSVFALVLLVLAANVFAVAPVCGDGVCDSGEDESSCWIDCLVDEATADPVDEDTRPSSPEPVHYSQDLKVTVTMGVTESIEELTQDPVPSAPVPEPEETETYIDEPVVPEPVDPIVPDLEPPSIVESGTSLSYTTDGVTFTLLSSVPTTMSLDGVVGDDGLPEYADAYFAGDGSGAASVTFGGLQPGTEYYLVVDNADYVAVTTDATGKYTMSLDLGAEHLVSLEKEMSTMNIYDDSTGGECEGDGHIWDDVNNICTLTHDVTEVIRIRNDALTLDCDGYSVSRTGGGLLIRLDNDNVTIKNCNVVSTDGLTGIGIRLTNAENCHILNNNVTNMLNRGILIRTGSNNNMITNNKVTDTGNFGFLVQDSNDNSFTGNTANDNGQHGFFFQRSNNNTLSDNTANNNDNNEKSGIRVDVSSNHNTLINNTANTNFFGILIKRSEHNTLMGNTAEHNIRHGILVIDDANYNNVTGNTVAENEYYGFWVRRSHDNTFTNNTVTQNERYGFYVTSEDDSTFIGNTVTDNVERGFRIGDYVSGGVSYGPSERLTLTGNTISGSGEWGIHLVNSNHITISGNEIYDCGASGIEFDSYVNDSTIHNNTLTRVSLDGGQAAIRIEDESHRNTISSNTIYDIQSGDGIQFFDISFDGCDNNTIIDNEITDAGTGIRLRRSNNNNLTNNTAIDGRGHGFYIENSDNCKLTENTANINGNNGFYLYQADDNTLTGNTADRNNNHGFRLTQSKGNSLTNNSAFANFGAPANPNDGAGFLVENATGTNTLENNTAYDNWQYGFWIYQSDNQVLRNNVGYEKGPGGNIQNDGFYVSDSDFATIEGNTAYNADQRGFFFRRVNNANFTNNNAYNNDNNGFVVRRSSNPVITNNTANNNGDQGLAVRDSSNPVMTNNTASNNEDNGIRVRNSHNALMTNNTANNNWAYGIYVQNSDNATMNDNTVSNNDDYGIYIYDSDNAEMHDNTANNNLEGFYVVYSNNAVMNDNTAHNNDYNGIYLVESYNAVMNNNTVHDHDYFGFNMIFSDNAVMNDNTAYNNRYLGYYLAYTNYLTFDNNVAYDNGDYGIYMYAWGANLTNNVLNDNGLGGIWLRSSAINNNIGLPGQGNMFCGNGDPDARDDDTNNWTDNVCDTTAGNAECERKCQSVTCTVKGQKPGTSAMKPLEGATCSIYDRNDPVVNQHHPDVYAIYEYAEILNRLSSCITDGLGECSVFVGSGDRIFGISEHPDFPGDLAGHDLGVVRTDNKNLVMTHPAGGNVNETATLGEGLSLPLLLVVLAIVGALAFAVQSLTKKRKR